MKNKTVKQMTKAELITLVRTYDIHRTERGLTRTGNYKLVGYVCGFCGSRWRGRAEKHKPECVLS